MVDVFYNPDQTFGEGGVLNLEQSKIDPEDGKPSLRPWCLVSNERSSLQQPTCVEILSEIAKP
jgi:hypothetical protein